MRLPVSLAQRLAWFEALSTLGVLLAMTLAMPQPDAERASAVSVATRLGVVVAVAIASFYYNDLYNFDAAHDLSHVFMRLCRALGLAAIVLGILYLAFPDLIPAGNLASHALMLTLVAVLAIRVSVYALAKREPFSRRVLIVGDSPLGLDLARQIRSRPDLAMRVVGFVGDSATRAEVAGAPRIGGLTDLGDLVRRERPDHIIVALGDRRGSLPVTDLLACRFRGIRVEEGSQAFERFTQRLAVESLSPSALIFGDGFRVSRGQLALKRASSLIIAVAGLIVSAPLMALIAVAITLESRGPVFFVQDRVGLNGRTFRLVKFRTMRPLEHDTDLVWARDNRSRVTRVGAVLRKYRLDELPQFINILRGDMSFVGPRPEMAENVATFSAVIPYYNFRHEVRPGLTGWAQVKAGYSMSTEEVTRKLCYDLYYIKHCSLAFDLRIIIDTVKFVLCGQRPG
jgi:sugar transferase (PEP-CTERM system associated)